MLQRTTYYCSEIVAKMGQGKEGFLKIIFAFLIIKPFVSK